ncbi:MAG: (2Fe-2S)-binding protein [Kofleriaceae bacterium]|nr:(2Fe-2S)-binding protein [Kofleriaceae bacterium]
MNRSHQVGLGRGKQLAAGIANAGATWQTCAMPRVRFASLAKVAQCTLGETLFDAGGKVSAGIETACVGKGTCGLCRVKILAGNDALTPFTDEEFRHLGNVFHITKVRLACRARIIAEPGPAADAAPGAVPEIIVEPTPKRAKKTVSR